MDDGGHCRAKGSSFIRLVYLKSAHFPATHTHTLPWHLYRPFITHPSLLKVQNPKSATLTEKNWLMAAWNTTFHFAFSCHHLPTTPLQPSGMSEWILLCENVPPRNKNMWAGGNLILYHAIRSGVHVLFAFSHMRVGFRQQEQTQSIMLQKSFQYSLTGWIIP